ncbi:MAG: monovalent cation/H+ antiporter subunit D family protein [Firmicutes bacterium]|nr:monovalent cation/H+ antiporter subunit D family protein [Bacillota bacterium]
MSVMPLYLILGGLIPSFAMPVLARWKKELCAPLTVLVCGGLFALSLYFGGQLISGGEAIYQAVADWEPPWGIEIAIEPVSVLMAVLITGLYLLIALYSCRALQKEINEESLGWYYVEFLLCMTAMLGLVITHDIFNMYVFIEVVGISACALVVSKGDRTSTEASLKYLLLATIGSGFILLAIGMLYMITGHLNMRFAGMVLAETAGQYPYVVWIMMTLFVVGFGIKSALFPLHLWLPDAHASAPSPSSAVLSSLVVKVYIIALFKLFFIVFGNDFYQQSSVRYLLLILGGAAMLFGSFFAFVQLDLKRRLAYSTVAQLGYIYLGLGLGTSWAIVAAFYHLVVHALMKTCLFLCAGAIDYQTGQRKVTRLQNIGFKMPLTAASFTVAALSMVGLPLTGGFISKYLLAVESMSASYPYFIALIVLSGLLNAAYYFPIIWQFYFVNADQPYEKRTFQRDKIPFSMQLPIVITAAGIVVLGTAGVMAYDYLQQIVLHFLS